jgi:hypothetical protein
MLFEDSFDVLSDRSFVDVDDKEPIFSLYVAISAGQFLACTDPSVELSMKRFHAGLSSISMFSTRFPSNFPRYGTFRMHSC